MHTVLSDGPDKVKNVHGSFPFGPFQHGVYKNVRSCATDSSTKDQKVSTR